MADRPGFDAMQGEITRRGGHLGGCWGPADSGTFNPKLPLWLCGWFPIKTVLDVGCGFGAHLRAFRALGCQVIGVEGLQYAAERCDVPVICTDLELRPVVLHGIDLAFSVETAEHVANWSYFLDTLCVGKVVAFSAAGPGQAGHHHVNCQPQSWWIERVELRGYTHFPKFSELARAEAGGYFGMSGMVFLRDDVIGPWGCDVGGYDP